MGSWFTRPLASEDLIEETIPPDSMPMSPEVVQPGDFCLDDQPDTTYCYCHGPESGSMLVCDNKDCPIEWFHLECLKGKESMIPKGDWYCPNCRKMDKFSSKGKKV